MARKFITFTALAATLAMSLTPVAASAHERDDRRGWQHDNGRHHGHDRDDRRGYYNQRGYDDRRGYEDQRAYASGYGNSYRAPIYNNGYNNSYGGNGGYAQGGYGQGGYDQGGYYADTSYNRDYYARCRNNGSTGTIVGAIAGGLIGNSVAGRGDRTLGTVLGGGVGALAGRAIDRGGNRC